MKPFVVLGDALFSGLPALKFYEPYPSLFLTRVGKSVADFDGVR